MALPAILQMLQGATTPHTAAQSPIGKLRQMIGVLKSARDPQALLRQLAEQRSPQLAQAMDLIKESGGDAKAAFTKLAKEQGLDLNDLWSLLG